MSEPLERLRRAAAAGYAALRAADLPAFGRAMQANTDAQADLAPGIVGRHACAVIDVARAHGALGWKVNGAGGAGGTVTVLLARPEDRSGFDAAVTAAGYAPLAVEVSLEGVIRHNET
jgi:D-glycero-alpha-D-manno-heptose-7-phosphate kinase